MKRFSLQHFWATAWKRFRQNFVAAVTLLPVSTLLGFLITSAGIGGLLISVESCNSRIRYANAAEREVSLPWDNMLLREARARMSSDEQEDKEELIERALALGDSLEEALSEAKAKLNSLTDEEIRDSLVKERMASLDKKKEKLQAIINTIANGQFPPREDPDFRAFVERYPQFYDYFYTEMYFGLGLDFSEVARNMMAALEEDYRQQAAQIKEEVAKNLKSIKEKLISEMSERIDQGAKAIAEAKQELEKKLEEIEDARPSFLKKFWIRFTTLILLVVYLFLTLVGITWLALGVDRLALSLNTEKGVSTLLGDVLPVPVGKIALNYIIAQLVIVLGVGLLVGGWLLLWVILGYIFGGFGMSGMIDRVVSLLPIFVLLSLVLFITLYLLLWPLNFYILSGKNFIQAIGESIRFFRSNYNSLLPFEISRFFILFFFLSLVLGKLFLFPMLERYSKKMSNYIPFLKHSSSEEMAKALSSSQQLSSDDTGGIALLALIVLAVVLFAFLTLMRAAFFVEVTQAAEENHAESSPSTPSA